MFPQVCMEVLFCLEVFFLCTRKQVPLFHFCMWAVKTNTSISSAEVCTLSCDFLNSTWWCISAYSQATDYSDSWLLGPCFPWWVSSLLHNLLHFMLTFTGWLQIPLSSNIISPGTLVTTSSSLRSSIAKCFLPL